MINNDTLRYDKCQCYMNKLHLADQLLLNVLNFITKSRYRKLKIADLNNNIFMNDLRLADIIPLSSLIRRMAVQSQQE